MLKRLGLAFAGLFAFVQLAGAAGTIPLSLTQQFDNISHLPLAGGQLFFIQAGTTSTPQNAFQDSALTLPYPNPLTLDAGARIPQLFFADGQIKIRLTNASGVTQLSVDNIQVVGASSGGGGGGTVDPTTILATGDIKATYGTGVIVGFVRLNGRTIGSASSGATERANADTQALFQYLWGADPNLVVSTGRGTSANADWVANKQITLPDWRGRALAGLDDMGNSQANRLTVNGFGANGLILGASGGNESQTLTLAQLPIGITSNNSAQAITVCPGGNCGLFVPVNSGNWSAFQSNGIAGSGQFFPISNNGNTIGGEPSFSGNNQINVTSNNTSGNAHPVASPMMLTTLYIKL